MKMTAQKVATGFAILLTAAAAAYASINDLQPVPLDPASVPDTGTFWSLAPDGQVAPPLPFAPPIPDASVYSLGNGQFFVGTEDGLAQTILPTPSNGFLMLSAPPDPEGDPGTNAPPDFIPNPRDLLRNAEKFAGHLFSLLDTNDVATADPDLYNALTAFPQDTNTVADLQIMLYQTNVVIIKANHFDYSAERRDFALLVSSKPESPTWKAVDLAAGSDSIDGWLIQGTIPNWKVTDAMFIIVSNISLLDNAFFRAVPYSGPQVQLTGAQPYDVVSNTITLQAQIMDLSGATNQQLSLTVDGLQPRCTPGPSNSFTIDTAYAPNGLATICATASSLNASSYDPTNPPLDTKLQYDGVSELPLDFENPTCVAFASETCSPDVGVNYIMFGIDREQDIVTTISDPADGTTLATYSGYVPYAATVEIPWDFTDLTGVPYTNDTYVVTFTAQAVGTTLTLTNKIDRNGVRTAAGCILTYEQENPATSTGSYLNSEATRWVGGIATALYSALYSTDYMSLTQYTPADIGPNRDNPVWASFPLVLTPLNTTNWATQLCSHLANPAFSDFGYYAGHANGVGMGGGPRRSSYIKDWIDSTTISGFVRARAAYPNWRMRKVALWACYTDSPAFTRAGGTYRSWQEAFGIRSTSQQRSNWMMKNVGLFFGGELPQGGISGTMGGTSAEVASTFDSVWAEGPTPYPGGCVPTYSFGWAFDQVMGMCPEIKKGRPTWIGFGYLPYTGIYDSELMLNNISHVTQ